MAFARFRFPFRNFLFLLLLSTLMLPYQVTIIPTFLLFKAFGWLDTYNPLIIPNWFGGGAFAIFLFRQFFLTIPKDLDEAAKIDGANTLWIFHTHYLATVETSGHHHDRHRFPGELE